MTTQEAADERPIDTEEAAALLGMRPKTLYRWASAGVVPSFKMGGLRRYFASQLRAWMAAQATGGAR